MKTYYPMKKSGKVYVPVGYSVLTVASDDDIFLGAVLLTLTETEIIKNDFTRSKELVMALRELPSRSWIISYNIDYMQAVVYDTIDKFTSIEKVGDNTNYIKLRYRRKEWYIVDIRNNFSVGLTSLERELGLEVLEKPESASVEIYLEYLFKLGLNLKVIWEDYVGITHETWNVYPSKSPGSTALKIFKTTIDKPLKPRTERARRMMINSVKAGALHWKPGIYDNAFMYDLNASYPYAMRLLPYPRHLQLFAHRQPPTPFWISMVRLNYASNLEFSPLHVPAMDGYHYSVDKAANLVTSINYIDYSILQMTGTVEITEYLEGVYWTPKQADYLFSHWSAQMEGVSSDTKGKVLTKVISRSLHSKFNQVNKPVIGIIKKVKSKQIGHIRGLQDFFPLADGKMGAVINKYPKAKFRPYDMPEYESLTLAMGRELVYSAVDNNTIYVDTDCIISKVERDDLSIGTDFGQWKLAHSGRCAIAGPRMYAFEDTVKSSGIHTDNLDELKEAIWKAASGKISILQTVERGGIIDTDGFEKSHDFTVRQIKYPKVEINGNYAYVTRSPTQQVGIIKIRQELI